MNLETKITIYKFTPQVFTLTPVPEKAPSTIKHGEMRRKCVYLQSS